MKSASKVLIALPLLLLLGAYAGSRAAAEDPKALPETSIASTHTIVFVEEEDGSHVVPGRVIAHHEDSLRFVNLTSLHAQVLVPKRTFRGGDGEIVEVPAGATTIVTVDAFLGSRGSFPYQVYLGGLPPLSIESERALEEREREWWGKIAPSGTYAIADSPPHLIIE